MATQEREEAGDLHVCDKCAFTTRKGQALLSHIHSLHNRLECNLCDYSTISDVWMREHVKRHEEQRYRCPDCDYATDSYRKICSHTVDEHQKVFGGADLVSGRATVPGSLLTMTEAGNRIQGRILGRRKILIER